MSSIAKPTTVLPAPAIPRTDEGVRRDTLGASVVFLIGLSCIQPLVAVARGLVFCRWLDPIQLGCWDIALAFMSLAAPLVVFGIPGSFGRYVEHYAQRGQLAMFLRRTTLATLALTLVAMAVVANGGRLFSVLIFNSPDYVDLVWLVALGLGTVIIFGFVVELLTALRMFRVVSGLQLLKGVGFAVFGAGLLLAWNLGPASLIVAHSVASLLGAGVGMYWLWATWRSLPPAAQHFEEGYLPARQLWTRLMPFALWMWATNILSNVFEIVDRTMIIHCSKLSVQEALTAVGQYHSSRIVPLLFVSFAAMLGSLVLPHLSRDWEAGRTRDVDARLNLTIKALSLALMAGSVLVLWISPVLFHVAFRGKYDGGLVVLPWTLAYCAWFGLSFIAGNYLLCAERVRLNTAALLAGLVANVLLNLALLPPLGLMGAVLATAGGKLLVLGLVLWFARMLGMKIDGGTWIACMLPLALTLGAGAAAAILAVTALTVLSTDRILVAEEKRLLLAAFEHYRARFRPASRAAG
ncbi:MAG: lipopolysaccharide biosynthesis protein [Planctomycetia bacterium]|nr:lipopolysaccharide biosynthesis protein [Planctomycetia bacterium]